MINRLALAVLLLGAAMPAHAQTLTASSCGTSSDGLTCTPQMSAEAAKMFVNAQPDPCTSVYGSTVKRTSAKAQRATPTAVGGNAMQGYAVCSNGVELKRVDKRIDVECPAGATWDEAKDECYTPKNCALEADVTNMSAPGNGGMCKSGCEYSPVFSVGTETVVRKLGNKTFASTWAPTGNECTTGDSPLEPFDPTKGVCKTISSDGHVQCLTPSGQECINTPRGSALCWNPDETGPRNTADGKEAADRKKPPEVPVPPSNIENPTLISETTSTVNNTTTVTNVYSGTGNSGGTGNTGGGGKDAGTGGGGGTGGGTGGGSGGGSGECAEGQECEDGPGTPAGDGEYKRLDGAEGRTPGAVFSAFRSRMSASPFVSAASGFFTVNAGGSCPSWTLPATDWTPSIALDFWCSSALSTVWQLFGYVLVIVYSWVAFRWAFL
jgi:hypothetical protein